MKDADYSSMTDAEFDRILHKVVGELSASELLANTAVYDALREECNDEVLTRWEAQNPERAFPKPTRRRKAKQ
jgi:hypothetical protein